MKIGNISGDLIDEVVKLMLKLWPECNYEEECENCIRIMSLENERIFVAKDNNQVLGFIQVSLRTDYVEGTSTSPVIYIEGLFVVEESRQKAIAKKLVKRGAEWGLKNGCIEMASDAELNNEGSIAFHKAIGFEEVNRIICFQKKIE